MRKDGVYTLLPDVVQDLMLVVGKAHNWQSSACCMCSSELVRRQVNLSGVTA